LCALRFHWKLSGCNARANLLQTVNDSRTRDATQIRFDAKNLAVFHRRRIVENFVRLQIIIAFDKIIRSGFNARAVSLLIFG
jgi:hypothetical protein